MAEPVVLGWRDDETETMAPEPPGPVTPERWREYGIAKGGGVEVDVGGDFHFILGEATELDLDFVVRVHAETGRGANSQR